MQRSLQLLLTFPLSLLKAAQVRDAALTPEGSCHRSSGVPALLQKLLHDFHRFAVRGSTSEMTGQGLLTPDSFVPNYRYEILLSMVTSLTASPSIQHLVGRVFVKRAEP